MFPPVNCAQFVQRAEDFVRQRHDNVFHSRGQLINVNVLRGLGGIYAKSKPPKQTYAQFEMSYKRHDEQFRLLLLTSYSGFNEANLNRNFRRTQLMP